MKKEEIKTDIDVKVAKSESKSKLKEIKWKIERFFGKNVIFFGIILVYALFNLNGSINSLDEAESNLKKEIAEIKMSYVAITDSGILNNLPRTFINPAEKGNEVAEVLKSLLVDRATLSKGFTVSEFSKPSDLLDNSTELQNFAYNYILIQRGLNDDLKEAQKSGYGYFQAYLTSLQELFRGVDEKGQALELPHYLKVIDKKVNSYTFKDNAFSIDVTYSTTINNFAGRDSNGKSIWKQKNGSSRIVAKGFFDIQTQNIGLNHQENSSSVSINGVNYSGLHFTYFKVYYGI